MDPKVQAQFFKAAKQGDLARLEQLLGDQPELRVACDADGQTALHCAAWKGQAAAVALLLAAGFAVDALSQQTHYGGTALHAAAHGNHGAVVRLLLDHGADPAAVSCNGRTPLAETEFHRATSAARVLREATSVSPA